MENKMNRHTPTVVGTADRAGGGGRDLDGDMNADRLSGIADG